MTAATEPTLGQKLAGPSDELTWGGCRVRDLAERFGTPFYAFDAGRLRSQADSVRSALGSRVRLLYALKANPNAAVASVLRRTGCGGEVASAGEIYIALKAGFDGSELQFAGPGKSDDDLRLAIDHGVCLNVESETEMARILRLATPDKPARAQLRVNPPKGVGGARMRMGGGSQKFGLESEELPALVNQARAGGDAVRLTGLHVYAGTQCFDADAWAANARFLLERANQLEEETGHSITTLNFGGGFGVPLFESDPEFDLGRAGELVQALIETDQRSDRQYVVELGRYLTAPSGIYVARVETRKENKGVEHAVLDGGLHHHAAAAGFGSVIRRTFPVVRVRAPAEEASGIFCLGGPLCTPADELGSKARLPAIEEGDLVAFMMSGAYGLTFSNVMFLSHPTPAELLVDGGKAMVVREAGRAEDAVRGQHVPS
jgi:diaminopimelate decarboxylase